MTSDRLRILIVDDEEIARERITRFLAEILNEESADGARTVHIDHAENGLEGVEKIESLQPHIVFLDIEMPGLGGFEMLAQIPVRKFHVVFQTAFDAFALRAFDECALDYLLKPYTKERLATAFAKARRAVIQAAVAAKLDAADWPDSATSLDAFVKLEATLRKNEQYLETISYKQGGRVRLVKASGVRYFMSRDHCTSAFTKDGEHLIDLSLSYLEKNLNPNHFIRCHRNTIVALEQIRSISGSTEPEIELHDGTRLALSRANRRKILERLRRGRDKKS
jgi:two-component system LytT family response regulator